MGQKRFFKVNVPNITAVPCVSLTRSPRLASTKSTRMKDRAKGKTKGERSRGGRCVVYDIVVRKIMYVIHKMCSWHGRDKGTHFSPAAMYSGSFARGPFVEGTILQRNEKFSRITDVDVPSPAATRR